MTRPEHVGWMRSIIQRPERCTHPICHVLLIGFLFGSIDTFRLEFERLASAPPDTQHAKPGDWGKPELELEAKFEAVSSEVRQHRMLVDTALSCRAVARQLGQSVNTIVSHRRALGVPISERRKKVTDEMLERVEVLFRLPDATLASVAAALRVSKSTVSRLKAQIGDRLPPRVTQQEQELKRDSRREAWLGVLQRCKDGSVNDARRLDGATYAWLYRNDREWLKSCKVHPPKRRLNALPKVDWAQRDLQIASRIEQHVNLLSADPRAPRITRTGLIRMHGEAGIRVNLHRMPCTEAVLLRSVESVEAYQCRRITVAVGKLVRAGQGTAMWKVLKESGLKAWSESLFDFARQAVQAAEEQAMDQMLGR